MRLALSNGSCVGKAGSERNTLMVCTFRAQSSAVPRSSGPTRISPGIVMTNGFSLPAHATSWPTPSLKPAHAYIDLVKGSLPR